MGWMTHRMSWFDWITLPFGMLAVTVWMGVTWVREQVYHLGKYVELRRAKK